MGGVKYCIHILYVHFHIRQTCRRTRVQVKRLIGKIRMIDFPPFLRLREVFIAKTPRTVPKAHIIYAYVTDKR